MRELLTDREVEILRTFANFNMHYQPTANAVHYHRRTLFNIFASIYKRTGLDPTTFWDLAHLIENIDREEADRGGKELG